MPPRDGSGPSGRRARGGISSPLNLHRVSRLFSERAPCQEGRAASGAGFTPAERAGGRGGRDVERSETSANPAYTTRRASVAPWILGGAPPAPPSSIQPNTT